VIVFAALAGGDPTPLLAALASALERQQALHLVVMGQPIGADFMKAVSAQRLVSRVTFGGLPPLGFFAGLAEQARAILFAMADPGLVEPYALIAIAAGRPILTTGSDEARALFEDAASYAGGESAAAIGAGLAGVLGAGPRAGAAVPQRFGRRALGERLRALYGGLALEAR
jgi:hypothetical protein